MSVMKNTTLLLDVSNNILSVPDKPLQENYRSIKGAQQELTNGRECRYQFLISNYTTLCGIGESLNCQNSHYVHFMLEIE